MNRNNALGALVIPLHGEVYPAHPETQAPLYPPDHPEYDNRKLRIYIDFLRDCSRAGININRLNIIYPNLNNDYLTRAMNYIRNNGQNGGYKNQNRKQNRWISFVQDNFKKEKAYLESQMGGNVNAKLGDVIKSLSLKYRRV